MGDTNLGFLVLDDGAWDDLAFPATAINPPGIASDPTFNTTYITWDFSSADVLFIAGQLPHEYKEGSSIVPHVHWQPSNTNQGTFVWKLEYTWRNLDGAWSSLTTSTKTVTPGGTAYTAQMDDFTTIAGTGMEISSLWQCKLSRAAADDNFTGDAMLIEFDIHFKKDALGSRSEDTK